MNRIDPHSPTFTGVIAHIEASIEAKADTLRGDIDWEGTQRIRAQIRALEKLTQELMDKANDR